MNAYLSSSMKWIPMTPPILWLICLKISRKRFSKPSILEDSAEVKELLQHEEDSAGGIMALEFISVECRCDRR